jgi:hypothetical protein
MKLGKTTLGKKTLLHFRQNHVRRNVVRRTDVVPTFFAVRLSFYNGFLGRTKRAWCIVILQECRHLRVCMYMTLRPFSYQNKSCMCRWRAVPQRRSCQWSIARNIFIDTQESALLQLRFWGSSPRRFQQHIGILVKAAIIFYMAFTKVLLAPPRLRKLELLEECCHLHSYLFFWGRCYDLKNIFA